MTGMEKRADTTMNRYKGSRTSIRLELGTRPRRGNATSGCTTTPRSASEISANEEDEVDLHAFISTSAAFACIPTLLNGYSSGSDAVRHHLQALLKQNMQ